MKRKEFQIQKEKPVVELEKEIREYRARLEVLRFDLAAGKVKNIKEIKAVKKNIAQLLTIRRTATAKIQ